MSFCSNCGRALKENARFCTDCGTTVDASLPPRLPRITKTVVATPKRGGWLAIKVFLVASAIYVLGTASSPRGSDASTARMLTAFAFGIGAVYVIVRLRKWMLQNDPVTGMAAGWIIATLMALMCLAGLAGTSGGTGSSSATSISGAGAATSDPSPTAADIKEMLIRDTKLDFAWSKGGFDSIMMADFTVHNSSQYRFKDVEIKCDNYAPSGTVVDSNTRTMFEMFEPHSTKKIKQMNMGFIHSQAARSGCQITNLTVL